MLGKCAIGQNGRTKTVLKGLLLSKERECYKGIDKQNEIIHETNIISSSDFMK